ncbi:hypothetical protein AB0H71_28975 [Nocardia sp. NPDC050697]|uniref:hypothetical protein n=1 Tax=Nocardia sp. NPDC050697 TaxID=3155158 RepID=UPI0033C0A920
MMEDKELFDLCKQVYEKTGWETERFYWSDTRNPEKYIPALRELRVIDYKPLWLHGKDNDDNHVVPLYTSDYIQPKLPPYYFVVKGLSGNRWYPAKMDLEGPPLLYPELGSDTPLKAFLKLTLTLHEEGELE